VTREAILHAVTDIVRDVLDDDSVILADTTSATDVPGWDSFAHINIVVASEKKFGIRFRTHEMEQLHNVGEFISLIIEKNAGK
jgi:acyl carrier protein